MSAGHPLVEMFSWWNQAYLEEDGFSPENFGQYFTSDAVFVVNGEVRSVGLTALSRHFQKVRDTTDSVRIQLPPEQMLQKGDEAFIHYRVLASVSGQDMIEIAMAHACLMEAHIVRLEVLSIELPHGGNQG